MKITVIQPAYFAGENPDEKIAKYLFEQVERADDNSLIVLPEYSNAGGLSDKEKELLALSRAQEMLEKASLLAKKKNSYIAINVLEKRNGKIRNSTYLFDKKGENRFVYDKIHLPPSEIDLGVESGDGQCFCQVDGIRFGFMTCYDAYYNEQIEYLAMQKSDVILIPGYQRGERTDIIRAQNKMTAFRCNSFIARASYSMDDDNRGGCSMIVAPDGTILKDIGKGVGSISLEVNEKEKYMRTAGFGGGIVRNDEFINNGLRKDLFNK